MNIDISNFDVTYASPRKTKTFSGVAITALEFHESMAYRDEEIYAPYKIKLIAVDEESGRLFVCNASSNQFYFNRKNEGLDHDTD